MSPIFRFYYMGFYIHSCPKMRYKSKYQPSHLLCPEAKTWHDSSACLPLLDQNKYSRLNPHESKVDEDAKGIRDQDISVLYAGRGTTNYMVYQTIKDSEQGLDSSDEDMDSEETNRKNCSQDRVREYARLVGNKCVKSQLLYLE